LYLSSLGRQPLTASVHCWQKIITAGKVEGKVQDTVFWLQKEIDLVQNSASKEQQGLLPLQGGHTSKDDMGIYKTLISPGKTRARLSTAMENAPATV
jgi:hypothetical protein